MSFWRTSLDSHHASHPPMHCTHTSHPSMPCTHFDSGANAFLVYHNNDNTSDDDDATSTYPDSLPDLVTDSGAPYPSSEPSSALISRGPLDVYCPGTCDINHAPNVVERLLGASTMFSLNFITDLLKAATGPSLNSTKGSWGLQLFDLPRSQMTTWSLHSTTGCTAFGSARLSPLARATA